jgi:hypothetical protein
MNALKGKGISKNKISSAFIPPGYELIIHQHDLGKAGKHTTFIGEDYD